MALIRSVGTALILSTCGHPDSAPKIVKGAGTTIYPNSDLRPLRSEISPLAFAAAVLGLSTVEVIRQRNTNDFEAVALVAPPPDDPKCIMYSTRRTSRVIATGDVNADGKDDVLIFDTCGNWLALDQGDGTFRSVLWSVELPALAAYPFLELLQTEDSGRRSALIVASGGEGAIFLGPRRDGEPWSDPQVAALPTIRSDYITNTFVRAPSLDSTDPWTLVFQGRNSMGVLDIINDGGAISTVVQKLAPVISMPYRVPFDGFDHLTSLSLASCRSSLFGVGFFEPTAGGAKVPRTLQRISLGPAEFHTEEIATSLDEVTTIAAVNVASGTMLGVLGKKGGAFLFQLWRQRSCIDFEKLATAAIDLDYRTVPAPAFGENSMVAKTNGVRLVAKEVDGSLEFVHYDGFDIRLIAAQPEGDGFAISEKTYSLHRERHDLSLVAAP